MSAADRAQTALDERGEPRSGDDLSGLLAAVADQGWGGDAGRRAVGIMRSACRREAMHWIRTAGWLTDEGLSEVWEQMDRLVRSGRFADAPGLLRVAVRRAYAAEAAAAQTGLGSASTRGLIVAVRRADVLAVSALDEDSQLAGVCESGRPPAPAWMRTLAAVLAMGRLVLAGPTPERGDGRRGRRGEHLSAVPFDDGGSPDRGAGGELVGVGAADPGVGSGLSPRSPGDRGRDADRCPRCCGRSCQHGADAGDRAAVEGRAVRTGRKRAA